jgi:RNA polymerase sigma-70 factor (ECF subfamily)
MQGNHTSPSGTSQAAGLETTSDETLVGQIRRDPEAFAELYRRHIQRIYHFHLLRTGNVEDAQDLTSQTFLAALESIEAYRGQGSFCGWLFGIAGHKVADHYRRQRIDAPLEMAEALRDSDPSPEDVAANRLQLALVSDALRTLAADQAEALTLRVFGGLAAAEVGRIMGKSEAAVKMLVHRGLRELRDRLTLIAEVSL